MGSLLEEILRLDEIGAHQGLVAYLQQEPRNTSDVIFVVYQLLLRSSFKGAFLVAKSLGPVSELHPITALALGLGGVIFNSVEDELQGRNALRSAVDHLDSAQQASIYAEITSRVIPNIVNYAFLRDDTATLLRLLELFKAATPRFRDMFDLAALPAPLDIEEMRRRGRARAQLVRFPGLPPGTPKQARRGIVALREHYLGASDAKLSRPHDIGPRVTAALNSYGWPTKFFGMSFSDPQADFRGIAAMCRETGAEFVILDDNMVQNFAARRWRSEMIAQLRWEMPNLKVVSIYLDPWVFTPAELIETSAMVDLIWSASPTLAALRHPAFADRVFMAPFPVGVDFDQPPAPLRPRMTFAGGVMGYNWHRALWLGMAQREGLPIERQLSTHTPDGLPVLDSYSAYLRRLANATCSLDFTMRSDLSFIAPARAFESISSGALLVEEMSPDIDHYFVAGEHYLAYSSFPELRAVAQFIEHNRAEAESIRKNGTDFFRSNYSDDKTMANLDLRLFHGNDA